MKITELDQKFIKRKMNNKECDKVQEIKEIAFNLATTINDTCEDSREKSLAITKIEEALFWATASIERNGITD